MDLFELLDNQFNLCKQVNGLHIMFFEEKPFWDYVSFTYAKVFEKEFLRSWKYSKGRITINELLDDLGLYSMSTKGPRPAHNEKDAFLFLQLYINIHMYTQKFNSILSKYGGNFNQSFKEISEKCSYILEKSGMQILHHSSEDYYLIVPNDEKLKTVAEFVDKDTALLLYEYSTPILKGNIESKRKILKLLANKFEPIISANSKKYQSGGLGKDIFNDLSFCLNNFEIRHSNLATDSKNYKASLKTYTNKDWEEIYDATYQLMLNASIIDNYNNTISKTINRHKSKNP